ncbi:Hypothetical predicted protein [Olea europaea subsp. europaea]|uniref:Uncharacterized protein n=1 Tax=Olea europaea subsp. europaea TaxID=158383 RepID=A0A8S0PXH2_OLEEU|nr:Hypothetical predicted protein [Olea europaea subsp. europaea]
MEDAELSEETKILVKGSGGHSLFPFVETTASVSKVIKNYVTLEDSKHDKVSDSDLFNSNDNVKACDIVVNAEHFYQSTNELKHNAEKFMDDESVFGFCLMPVGQENYNAIRVEKHSNFEVLSCEKVDSAPIPSISTETWSDQIKGSKRRVLIADGGEDEVEEVAPGSIGEYTLDGKYSFRTIGRAIIKHIRML